MEHVWQSVQEHAAGALDIAEDPPGFFAGCYLGAVPCFPGGDEVEKCFPIRRSGSPGDPEEDPPQPAGTGRFREAPAPDRPLPLDMDQAALEDRIRPERPGESLITCGLPSTVKLRGCARRILRELQDRRNWRFRDAAWSGARVFG